MFDTVFRVKGKKKLSGSVCISGSKNAALPILAASLAINGISEIKNIPKISDIELFFDIINSIGGNVKYEHENDTTFIDATNLKQKSINLSHIGVNKMRASILLLAPLLIRFGEVSMPLPGGCNLGKRSIYSHLYAFKKLGAEIIDNKDKIHIKLPNRKFTGNRIIMSEISVTATENAIIAAAFATGKTEIRLAAAEPHVKNLCEALISTGINIQGVGTHNLIIEGKNINEIKNIKIEIIPDYLEAGTFILAGILTNSEIKIKNVIDSDLDIFFNKLTTLGANFQYDKETKTLVTKKSKKDFAAVNIETGVFPKFPTDLHPPFAVLLTQCQGKSKIFETLFEKKFAYLLELDKMGANIEIANPHCFFINGKKNLNANTIASQDIRAGAAMILAALIADGTSTITNVHYIDRGYENLVDKFKNLGASIDRVKL